MRTISATLGLLSTVLLVACDDRPAAKDTLSSPTQAHSSVTPASAVAAQRATTPSPTAEDPALIEAKTCCASRFLQRGDSWVTTRPDWDYIEYNKPTFTLTRMQSPSDSLNGYEYRARVHMSATAMRVAYILYPLPPWGEWTPGGGVQFDLVKQRGVWRCMAAPYDSDHQNYPSFDKLAKPDPNKLPR